MPAETEKLQRIPEVEEPLPIDPVIEAYKRDVDRTLLRENLKLTMEQRLQDLERMQSFVEELQGAFRKGQSSQ